MSVATPPTPAPTGAHSNEFEKFRRFQATGENHVRDGLIERALPLAHQIARRYVRSGDQFDDVLQVARLGLVKAVNRFDPDRGVAFSTYAVPTMVGEIKRHFRDTRWSVHVPRSLQERVLKVEQAEKTLSGRLGRAPTVGELAELLELDQEEVLEAMEAGSAYEARSLEAPAPTEDDEGRSYADTLGGPENGYELVEDLTAVSAAVKSLPARERRILHMRFMEDMTQSEIAKHIGVSQMQISRLLRRALTQLREVADPQPREPTHDEVQRAA
jgi:RNA polymerase sigma-B factor